MQTLTNPWALCTMSALLRLGIGTRAVFVISALLMMGQGAYAQANRVFVSSQNGNDGNSCTLNDPCRTFARAFTQVQTNGEIIALDSGGYGQIVITRSVSILAGPGVFAGIAPTSGDAIKINIGPTDVVVLRGLTLNNFAPGNPNGISVVTAGTLHVESCLISGFSKGIYFNSPGRLHVRDTTVLRNGEGIVVRSLSARAFASIEHCRMERNQNWGLLALDNASVTARDSVAAGNLNGFIASASLFPSGSTEAALNIENCVATNNLADGITAGGLTDLDAIGFGSTTVRVSNSTVTDNVNGLAVRGGGTVLSRSNNTVEGNGQDFVGAVGGYAAK